ncbi:MAG: hypothetical protein JO091_10385 [Acidobacteriaceae bacterium]|nr:hypothetical protein [Acidobacteriaceae bacterium]
MNYTRIHLESQGDAARQFRTGVSLHSHTLHSRETLGFLERLGKQIGPIRTALAHGQARYRRAHGSTLDLSRAWWTPPAAPRDAWWLEKRHIERYGLQALVSLSDHDDIEAPLSLRVLEECRGIPISVEWTVPYGPTFFHLGVHNLYPDCARALMRELAEFTHGLSPVNLSSLLRVLVESKDTLIVFNHPCWDENGIGHPQHVELATYFLHSYGEFIHALELNGLRPWAENRDVFRMGQEFGKPIVAGGDRHALEANTVLDLTNATTFSEYVEQVRSGRTDVLVTEQYREPFALRILQSIEEILQDHENHGRGWRRWSDRVFYQCDDGVVRSLTSLFGQRVPRAAGFFVRTVHLIRQHSLRQTCRFAFPRQELAL